MSDQRHTRDDSLEERMQAIVARLGHAREILNQPNSDPFEEVRVWTEAYREELSDLSAAECQRLQPTLLALFDELGQTIIAYQTELRRMRTDLTSAHQGQAADAAYRQAQKI